jgi:hypothetical protein
MPWQDSQITLTLNRSALLSFPMEGMGLGGGLSVDHGQKRRGGLSPGAAISAVDLSHRVRT